MKTQAQSAAYNVGCKMKIKMYEDIAKYPNQILALVEDLCDADEERDAVKQKPGLTLRETLDAVSWILSKAQCMV